MLTPLRRRATTLAGFFLLGAAPLWAQAQYVYIGSQNSYSGIAAYSINESTGAIAAIPGSPFAAGQYVLSVVVHPAKPFLYAASQGAAAGIYAFTVTPGTGALTVVAGSPYPAGTNPLTVALHPSGKFLYAISEAGSIYAYQINAATGELTAAPGSPLTPGATLTALGVEPQGRFVYVGKAPGAVIMGYAVNTATGALTALAGTVPAGTTPSSITGDPTGRYLYVTAAGTTKGVFAFLINPTGALTALTGSPYTAGTVPIRGIVDPSGKFFYVANGEFAGGVSAYGIALNGQLTALAGSPFALSNNPQGIAIDAEGKFVYVPTFNGGAAAFSLNPTTGALTPVAGSPFPAPYASRPIAAARIDTRTFSFTSFAAQPPTFFIDQARANADGTIGLDLIIANFERRYPNSAGRANANRGSFMNDCWFQGSSPNTGLPTPPAAHWPIFQGGSPRVGGTVNAAWGFCLAVPMATRDMAWLQPDGFGSARAVSLADRCRNLPGCDPDTLLVNTGQFVNYLRHPEWPAGYNLERAYLGVARWGNNDVLPLGVEMWSHPAAAGVIYTWMGPLFYVHLMKLPIGTAPPPGVVIGNPKVGAWPEGTLFLHNPSWEIPGIANIAVVTDGGGPFVTPRTTPVTEVDMQLVRNDAIQQTGITYPPSGTTPPGGLYIIRSTFKNITNGAIGDLCFRVAELSGGATQLEGPNLITPPGGRGAASCWGPLAAGANKQVQFNIRLAAVLARFTFYVDAYEGSAGPRILFNAAKSEVPAGQQHIIVLAVVDPNGVPMSIPVEIMVTSPAHATRNFFGVTGVDGLLSFPYSQATPGVDTVKARLTDSSGYVRYATATVTWK